MVVAYVCPTNSGVDSLLVFCVVLFVPCRAPLPCLRPTRSASTLNCTSDALMREVLRTVSATGGCRQTARRCVAVDADSEDLPLNISRETLRHMAGGCCASLCSQKVLRRVLTTRVLRTVWPVLQLGIRGLLRRSQDC